MKKGYIHSFESFGTVDGPGIRFVVFMQGCPMRCLYCHNPDTWDIKNGKETTVDEIISEYEKCRNFCSGGLTVTGGEPLVQPGFVTELLKEAKKRNIHTCIDTSGITFKNGDKAMDEMLSYTDLVMLDIKHIDNNAHIKLTGMENTNILEFARYLDSVGKEIWIRHVVVPGFTDGKEDLFRLGEFIGTLKNIKALDVLPYHDMGKAKYRELNIPYPLENTAPLEKADALKARSIILDGMRKVRK